MKVVLGALIALLAMGSLPATAQETPATMTAAYASLADSILALRQTEADFVRSLLDGHLHAAKALKERGDWDGVAAQMALFANEGDNAVAGVRKRLLEGGHHHHSSAEEEQGIYEPGYVIVTRDAKQKMLAASAALRQAMDDDARMAAWSDFKEIAKGLLASE